MLFLLFIAMLKRMEFCFIFAFLHVSMLHVIKTFLHDIFILLFLMYTTMHFADKENKIMCRTKPPYLPKPDMHHSSINDCKQHIVPKGILFFALC